MISIISLVYNHENYLHDFFSGILNQKIDLKIELLVGVDKSDDASLAICKLYEEKYPAIIRVIEHTERVGMYDNFISVYNECKGEFIAICDGDDCWTDEFKLQKQVEILNSHPTVALCFSDMKVYDTENKTYQANWASINKTIFSIRDVIKQNMISTCTVMFRNGIVKRIPDYFKGFDMIDWPLYILILTKGDAYYLSDTTAVYRQSNQSSYSKNSVVSQLKKQHNVLDILKSDESLKIWHSVIIKSLYSKKYAIAIRLGNKDLKRKEYLFLLIRNPLLYKDLLLYIKSLFRYYR